MALRVPALSWRAAHVACLWSLACGGSFSMDEPDTTSASNGGGASGSVAGVSGSGGRDDGASAAGGDEAGSDGQGESGAAGAMEAGGASSGGSAGEPSVPDPDHVFCDAVTEVFQVSCGNGSCHSNPRVTIGDFAVGPEEAAAFVDKPSAHAECGMMINSDNPAQSLILTKVTGAYPRDMDCGARMPPGSFAEVTQEQIFCLGDWVEQFRR